ncbi:MAG TPA: alpha/beta fold hydrolase [Pyrinomonadaceae bacterium]|nr:alpha/beta fold hydrolase [Pyrinomonadaceae bacterium]
MRVGGRILKRIAAWKWWILIAYLLLLGASYLVRSQLGREAIAPEMSVLSVPTIHRDQATGQTVRLAYRDYQSEEGPNASVVVLLQGSPGDHRDFLKLAPELARRYRVIAPDLPGFGSSSHAIPDYSNRAHARYVLEMLDKLHIQKAHFVGFSMGGGVALNIADMAPERIASLTMLSGIGVQEMELLGNYHLNHAIHGAQLAFLWFLHNGVPHFGWFDHSMLDLSYARNFYDTDQRPLRGILSKYSGPMLIIHGEHDVMVPVEVAREDYRLVPQSELVLFPDENHFYVFGFPQRQAAVAIDFFDRVEKGQVRVKTNADPQRVALAAAPFNPASSIPKAMGPTALVLFGLLALATLLTEDLTCVWAGVLAAEGRISFAFAAIACLFGIFIGDILLFLAGRLIGRTVLRHAPLKWFVCESDVERSSIWFRRRGMNTIVVSRFLPGTRLPTYFAAGLLRTSFVKFTFYFLIAAAVWTPLLVGASMVLGREVIESTLMNEYLFLRIAITALVVFIGIRLLLRLASFRGRRLLLGRWRRLGRWEFWPPWVFYPPVVLYVAFLGLKHRSATLFTCANPAIEEGGFIGESKSRILQGLAQKPDSRSFIARSKLLKNTLCHHARLEGAREFMRDHTLSFPVVLKPDAGERGSGVSVIRSDAELNDYLHASSEDNVIIQEYADGLEFGCFYYRYPESQRGNIFSITRKLFPSVIGDGVSTLEKLILKDDRAICMARVYCNAQQDRLWDIPEKGKSVELIEIGTHCRGSIFLDGREIKTEAMENAVDRLAQGFNGFYFGRFDIRTPSLTDFQQGRNFKVIELNGVTSEATNIYDPRNSLVTAYRVLFHQWRIAFEIGAQNRKRGATPASLRKLASLVVQKWRKRGERSGPVPRPIVRETDSAFATRNGNLNSQEGLYHATIESVENL